MKNRQTRVTPAFSVHLDAIRALAALVVFLGHARQMFLESPTQAVFNGQVAVANSTAFEAGKTTWGHQSVIVFFVLSGFFVGGSVVRDVRLGRWSWSGYLSNRMTRLWITLIPALLLGYALDSYGIAHFAGRHAIYDAPRGQIPFSGSISARLTPKVLVGNIFFLQTIKVDYLGTNPALWSLANEFWYYMAFPILALACFGARKTWLRASYAILCLCILLFVGPAVTFYFPIWMAGVAVSLLPCVIPESRLRPATFGAVVFFILLNLYLRLSGLSIELSDGILAVGFSVLLYCILHYRKPAKEGFYQSSSRFLAGMSYTLYLNHLVPLALVSAFLVAPWHRWTTTPVHLLQFLLVIAGVFIYTVLVYFCFEANTGSLRNLLRLQLKRMNFAFGSSVQRSPSLKPLTPPN